MESQSIFDLIRNSALLVAITALLDIFLPYPRKMTSLWQQVMLGAFIGIIGVALMLQPLGELPDSEMPSRTFLLGVTGLFFDPIPAVIAIVIPALFRLYLGGGNAWSVVVLIVAAGCFGILWRQVRRASLTDMTANELLLFSLILNTSIFVATLLLPIDMPATASWQMSLLTIVYYSIGATVLGMLVVNRYRRERTVIWLEESERRYRMLAENVTDVLLVIDLQLRKWIFISPSIARLLGYSIEELAVLPAHRLMPPDAYARTLNLIMKRTATLVDADTPQTHEYLDEIEFLRADGAPIWTEVSCRFLLNEDRKPILFGVVRDITERKRLEETLQSQDEILGVQTQALDAITEAVVVGDIHGNVIYCNPAAEQVYGWSQQEIINNAMGLIITEESSEQAAESLAQLEHGRSWVGEMTARHKDGRVFPVMIVDFPLRDKNGQITGVMSISTDISERKAAEAQAFDLAVERERTRLLSAFTESVSHEFRTPLAVIQSNLYVLERVNDPTTFAQKMQAIKRQLSILSRLVDMLTESAQISASNEWYVGPVEINWVILGTIENMRQLSVANRVEVVHDLA
ncbi:MAG: PAS domain S-box protein, partial [Caldilineaceae bacterium]|nr:PAS domain S-box protein [Caldilineaceae bacterium]